MAFSEPYADVYDLLYAAKDYAREAVFVGDTLRRARRDARTVLEFGSGTGRHARHLADLGFAVTGVDRSEAMLRRARALGDDRLRFVAGDMGTAKLDGTFDAAVALFHVVSYLQTDADILDAFANVRRHLRPGGLFLFDFWYGPAVLTQKPETRIREVETEAVHVVRLAQTTLKPNENLAQVDYGLFCKNAGEDAFRLQDEVHVLRYLFLPELRRFLEMSGFRHLRAMEWITDKPLDATTWNGTVVAEAVASED